MLSISVHALDCFCSFYFLIVSLIHLSYLTRGRYWRVWSKKTSWFVFIFIRHVFVENIPSARHYSKAVGKIILPICSLPSFGRRQTINIDTSKTGKGIGCASGMENKCRLKFSRETVPIGCIYIPFRDSSLFSQWLQLIGWGPSMLQRVMCSSQSLLKC